MKILVVSDGLELGGIERSLIGMLGPLCDTGHEVDLYLFRHEGELFTSIDPRVTLLGPDEVFGNLKTPISEVLRAGRVRLGMVRLLAKLVAKLQVWLSRPSGQQALVNAWASPLAVDLSGSYDLALGFQGPHDFVLDHVSARTKVGWVHTDYGYAELPVEDRREYSMWSRLDFVATVGDAVAASFAARFPDLKSKALVVENTFDPKVITALAGPEGDVVNLVDSPRRVVLCTVGRYTHQKGFDIAVEACRLLVSRGLDLEWHAIGFGPDEKELKALIEAHALQDRFLLVGKKVNPYPCIRSCDIYVQPSRCEGKAVAVREAQTLGRPVVVRNFDTAHDQVRHGWDGIVSGHSAEELADSIEGLMEDEALMTKLSSNALATDYSNRDAVTKMLHDIDERTARR